ncbi:uncharacterized protein LOC117644548 isoform X2 [Thrips palmi]|uniref:Uncharacterized protein LOC117644548 isoform X2 n=1 Tax=Thrips palmi TaxID=161013 RepID=A0A6P8ZM51_THRPL|nr:uncharacterized protein LOC117644548 isoform X2 [Thrips palmi]
MSSNSSANGEDAGPCAVCGAQGRACARCRVDFYCGKDHQLQDWPRHKLGCSFLEPFTMCVGCGSESRDYLAACVAQCKSCGWPVCSAACGLREEHQAECGAFQRAGFKLKAGDANRPGAARLDALTALRVGLAFADTKVGASLRRLPSRLPDLQAALKDAGVHRQAVEDSHKAFAGRLRRASQWLRDEARVHCLSAEELERGLAVALLNGMEGASGSEFYLIGGVFAGLSLVGHSCLPTAWRYACRRDSKDMQLVASRDVAKGERLTTSFIRDPLSASLGCDTQRRRAVLADMTGRVCRCALCEDPTQRGLYLNSWRCACWQHHGCHELVLVLEGGRWRCDGCGCEGATSAQDGERFLGGLLGAMVSGRVGGGQAWLPEGAQLDGATGQGLPLLLEEYFGDLVAARTTEVAQWEEFIADALPPNGPLHPTHHLVLRAKRQILCPDKDGVEADITNLKLRMPKTIDEARRYSSHGRDLLRAVEVLRPGVNHYRTDLLRQLVVLDVMSVTLFAALPPWQCTARRAEWTTIVKEFAEDLSTVKKASVSPFEVETVHSLISQKNMLLAALNPVLKKDTQELQVI